MKHACVIGWPVEHSRSPLLHGYWLKKYGIDGTYTKRAVAPEAVADFLRSLRANGYVGCNVTVPHKAAAFSAADEREDSAKAVSAANTLWLSDGKLVAANTDTYGYMTNLSQQAPGWDRRDAPVSILGAGGAARAIVFGFLDAGVSEIRVFNRTRARAETLAQQFGSCIKVLDWSEREAGSRDSAVLVNTTTIGMNGAGTLDLDLAGFDPECVVSDIVYVPLETELLRKAKSQGLRTVDGLGMLLHQGVPGFEKWFGVRPEVTDELRNLIVGDIEGG
ncbi:MAG: shikimate dehydrogenase [Hyphomicrobiaceae bacterium]|nr:shikimate dehydrogenase [Hyphomicrobiaceae bacterium]